MIRRWHLAHGRQLELGATAKLMGILNVTPDSFSDGGRHINLDLALRAAEEMVAAGASILDIGGESTRPNAESVTADLEQARILPLIEAIAGQFDCLISVDTYRYETARLAVTAGAHIINDVWGLQREPEIADLAAQTGAGLIIMHTGRERERANDVLADQFDFLGKSLEIAAKAGVNRAQIALDPGFGFAKDTHDNVELMARFKELQRFDLPLVAGTSRKRFIGALTGREIAAHRDAGTAVTSALLRLQGADIFRVHDIISNREALLIADAMVTVSK